MVEATPKKALPSVENKPEEEFCGICIALKEHVKIFLANPGCSEEETGTAFKTIRPYTSRALTICCVNKPIWE